MMQRKRDKDPNGYADVFFCALMGDEDVVDYDDYNEDDDEDNDNDDDDDDDDDDGDDDQDNDDNATITVGNN